VIDVFVKDPHLKSIIYIKLFVNNFLKKYIVLLKNKKWFSKAHTHNFTSKTNFTMVDFCGGVFLPCCNYQTNKKWLTGNDGVCA
jgi:hypothetical protein